MRQTKRHSRNRPRSMMAARGGSALLKVNALRRERDELLHRLQLQFERMPIACVISDPQMRIIDWNSAAERMFGYRREEVLGKNVFLLLAASSRRASPEDINCRLIGGDMSARALTENTTSDGQIITCEWHNTLLRDADGRVVAIQAMVQDISDRTKREEKLRRSEALLAEAQRVALLGNWDWNLRSGELIWSDECYRIFGLPPQEMSRVHDLFLTLLHKDDRERIWKIVQAALRDFKPYECDMRIINPGGKERSVHVRGIVECGESGDATRLFGTIQDTTEQTRAQAALRESEERVRLLLDSTAEAIYGLDLEGKCTFCNPACVRLLGYRDASELLARPMHALMHHTRRDGTPHPFEACRVVRVLARGEKTHSDDEVFWRADGTSFPAECWSHPLRREGQVIGAVVTFLDITRRRRLEKQILTVSEQVRRRLGQDLHDDLCQQLTGIAFTGKLLQQRLAEGSVSEARIAAKIVAAAQEVTVRARDLAKGLHPVQLETNGLGAALRELASSIESMFRVTCRFRRHPGADKKPTPDAAVAIHLYRIAQEAATNAVKHGRAKNITITWGIIRGRMTLSIADDGMGIVPSARRSGLGLRIMRQRAHVIGAALRITRPAHNGTVVTCSLASGTAACQSEGATVEGP